MVACAKFAHATLAQLLSPHDNLHLGLPEAVNVAVGDGMESSGEKWRSGGLREWRSWKCDSCLEDGGGEEVGTVGTEFGAGEFDG